MQAIHSVTYNELKLYIDALLGANAGISELQARTMIYYVIATYYDEIDPFPILLIKNDFGCGKSDLLETLYSMCKSSKWIKGTTEATIRDDLGNCRTAFFDENEELPEKWLARRFKRSNAQIGVKSLTKAGWEYREINLFGATVVAKRKEFKDGALTSRCLIIQPEYVENCNCEVTNVGSLEKVVNELGKLPDTKLKSGRVSQVWRPLEGIAKAFNDDEWVDWAKVEFEINMEAIDMMKHYEPREAVLEAIEICRNDRVEPLDKEKTRFKLSTLRDIINTEMDTQKITAQEIGLILIRNGYSGKVKPYHGYMAVELGV